MAGKVTIYNKQGVARSVPNGVAKRMVDSGYYSYEKPEQRTIQRPQLVPVPTNQKPSDFHSFDAKPKQQGSTAPNGNTAWSPDTRPSWMNGAPQPAQSPVERNAERFKRQAEAYRANTSHKPKNRTAQNPNVVRTRVFDAPTGQEHEVYATQAGHTYDNREQADNEQNAIDALTRDEEQRLGKMDDYVASLYLGEKRKHEEATRQALANSSSYLGNRYGSELAPIGTIAHGMDMTGVADKVLNSIPDTTWQTVANKAQRELLAEIPNATDGQITAARQQAINQYANHLSETMYNAASEDERKQMGYNPHFLTSVLTGTSVGQAIRGYARAHGTGLEGALSINDEWQANHPILSTAANITGMAVDPLTHISGGVGSGVSSKVMGAVARRALPKVNREVATRMLQSELRGQLLQRAVAGGANFATFEVGSTMARQLAENRLDIGEVAGSGLKGAVLGGVIGAAGGYIGNATDRAVANAGSRAGAIAKRVAGTSVGIGTEISIFAAPDAVIRMMNGEDAGDAVVGSLKDAATMVLGFKAQHALTAGAAFVGERMGRPASRGEALRHKTFWKDVADRMASTPEMGFTETEREELHQYGYDDLADMSHTRATEFAEAAGGKEGEPIETEATNAVYDRVAEMINDNRLSETARAKMAYIITGKRVPMSSVLSSEVGQTADGKYYADAMGYNGVISHRVFDNEAAARRAAEDIDKQAEINTVQIGERYKQAEADNGRIRQAIEQVAAETGTLPEALKRLYEERGRNPETLTEEDIALIGEVEKAYDGLKENFTQESPEDIREQLNEERGVDIDNIIRKDPKKRTTKERWALEDYLRRLYPEERTEQAAEPADSFNPDGYIERETPFERGRRASDLQERRDIVLEQQSNPESQEANEALDGLEQRIREDASLEAAKKRAAMKPMYHKDGNIRPVTLKEKDADGHDQEVYIVDGNVQMMPDGSMIDSAGSDKTIVVYNPTTGKNEMKSPDDFLALGEVKTPENIEAAIDKFTNDYIYSATLDTVGARHFTPGEQFNIMDEAGEVQAVQVVGPAVDKDGNPMEGTVSVMINGQQIVYDKNVLQNMAGVYDMADYKQRKAAQQQQQAGDVTNERTNEPTPTAEAGAEQKPTTEQPSTEQAAAPATPVFRFEQDDSFALKEEDGTERRGIVLETTPDGVTVEFEDGRVEQRQPAELQNKVTEYNGQAVVKQQETAPAETQEAGATLVPTGEMNAATPTESPATPATPSTEAQRPTAVQQELDAIIEELGGDATAAGNDIQATVDGLQSKLDKAKKNASKPIDRTDQRQIAARQKAMQEAQQLQQQLDHWKEVQAEHVKRQTAELSAQAEQRRAAQQSEVEAEAKRKAEQTAAEEAARIEREKLNGVPDVVNDKPADARARGFRNVSGYTVNRQQETQGVVGRESSVKFSTNDTAQGNVKVIEADQLQPSHVNGQRNPLFFIDEAQPKDRTDKVSSMAAARIAANLNPEEITGDGSAFDFSAPTTNTRGEVIQGNNRSDALKLMYSSPAFKEAQDAYKQYLINHAEEYGLDAEAIKGMKNPVMVNELDVDDAEAIRLGQFKSKDLESGGVERIDPVTTAKKLGSKVSNYSNVLLQSKEEGKSISDLLVDNGTQALKYLHSQGAISDTEYSSAFDTRGNLTPEAKADLQNILKHALFEGGVSDLPSMFEQMPAKAQKAILSTFMRDFDSAESDRILPELQKAIEVWNEAAAASPEFKAASTYEEAKRAMRGFTGQYQMMNGESVLPTEKFSNFAIELACRMQGSTMRVTQDILNDFFDLVQGKGGSLFDGGEAGKKKSLEEAIADVFGIDYKPLKPKDNGEERSKTVAADSQESAAVRQGEQGDTGDGEPPAAGTGNADGGGRVEGDGEVKTDQQGNPIDKDGKLIIKEIGSVDELTDEDFTSPTRSVQLPALPLKVANAIGSGDKPIIIKKNIFAKNAKSHKDLSPAESRDILKEVLYSPDKYGRNQKTTRPCNWILIHLNNHKHSAIILEVSNDKDNVEVVNWHYLENDTLKQKERQAIKEGGLILTLPQGNAAGNAVNNSLSSASKDKETSDSVQEKEVENSASPTQTAISEAEKDVDTDPTEAQKKANNYKHGHVKVDGYDISIENKKGSVRTGKDDKGNILWQNTMHNTYGYIRGTEGTDGDHIDVFLSDNPEQGNVYVVDQVDPKTGKFDEHKVMYGFGSMEEAREAYLSNYEKGWKGLGTITEVSKDEFKKWINSSHRKTKPFAEYKSVKANGDKPLTAAEENEIENRAAADYADSVNRALERGGIPDPKKIRGQIAQIGKRIKTLENGMATGVSSDADMRKAQTALATLRGQQRAARAALQHFKDKLKAVEEAEKNVGKTFTRQGTTEGGKPYKETFTVKSVNGGKVGVDMNTAGYGGPHTFTVEELEKYLKDGKWTEERTGDNAPLSIKDIAEASGGKIVIGGPRLTDFKEERTGEKANERTNEPPKHEEGEDPIKYAERVSEWQKEQDKANGTGKAESKHPKEQPKQEQPNDDPYHTAEEKAAYEELKRRMRERLNQLNVGIDPVLLDVGLQMAAYHFKGGMRRFADFCRAMIEDCGDKIRPHLKTLYNAFAGTEDAINKGWDEEMDDRKAVREFDVYNFDKKGAKDLIGTAEHVEAETKSQEQGEKILNEVKQQRNEKRKKNKKEDKPKEPSLFDALEQEAEETKPVQKPEEELSGNSADYQRKATQEHDFVSSLATRILGDVERARKGEDTKPLTMAEVKKMAEKYDVLKDLSGTDLQEMVEVAMTKLTRTEAALHLGRGEKAQRAGFDRIVALYNAQPLLNTRDSTRTELQQYSTPTPFGYVMGQFVRAGKDIQSGLEPSAGNGALTIAFKPSQMHVNDIDERRLANLRTLGYGKVTSQNGLLPFEGEQVDAVLTNPPFGSTATKEFDGGIFKIGSLEGLMAINGLGAMKDDGRAAIVIGGNTEYRENGVMKPKDMNFFGYLYSHYNVADVINLDGAMYARNGTKYPVRIILIDGRKTGDFKRVIPPVKSKARAEQVHTFDELYNRVQDDIQLLQQRPTDGSVGGNGQAPAVDGSNGAQSPAPSNQGHAGSGREPVQHDSVGGGGRPSQQVEVHPAAQQGGRGSHERPAEHPRPVGVDNDNRGNAGSSGSVQGQEATGGNRNGGKPAAVGGNTVSANPERGRLAVNLGQEKVAYPNRSQSGTLMSVVPAAQAQVLADSLAKIGDVDQFLVDKLGYSSKEELFGKLAAEQIDSVALAIDQMSKGNAFIIGDMTGVGKGRQGAALIRYAVGQGKKPIYFTQKPQLFADNYRDLCDIGSSNLRPFIIASNNDGVITDAKGNVVYKLPTKAEVQRVMDYVAQNGTLPDEYDYAIVTYSQIQAGTMDYEAKNGRIVEKAKTYKGKVPAGDISGQKRRDMIEQLSRDNYMILDESHTVAGNSGTGGYMQMVLQRGTAADNGVAGVTFLSATFAKRSDNMPVYALRTALSEAGIPPEEMIQAIAQGGVTLQEIMSKQLVQSGQMIRRERSFEGVNIDWLPVAEEADKKQREQFNEVSGIFSAIRAFQDDFIRPLVSQLSESIAEEGSYSAIKKGTEAMGVNNVPFASKMYNLVNQLLFALKSDAVADRVIANLKNGYKPVISFTNTMEGFLEEAPQDTPMDKIPNFSMTLMRALDGVMRYQVTDADGKTTGDTFPLSQLPPEGQAKYNEIRERIINLSADLPISPMDAIKMKIEDAGYTVGEITGREVELTRDENGKYVVRNRTNKDKKEAARLFNNGGLDVLMINKSGSTGISLHASPKFSDTRQRVMVFAQFQSDINDEVQMRGRIDRTGQQFRGRYEYIMSTIPAEQRLQMMFKDKLKSLDANTTSSQKSKFNEMEVVDFLNKYGDEVVWEYMKEHPELEEELGDPLKMLSSNSEEKGSGSRFSDEEKSKPMPGGASKVASYLAFLPVERQEEIFKDITETYAVKMQLLNDAGENDLEITTMPLRAETKSKKIWKEGKAPNSGNAFADNTYLEEVEVDVLKKPMKADEARKYSNKLSGDKPYNEWKGETRKQIADHYNQKAAELAAKLNKAADERAAKTRAKYVKDATKAREQGKNNWDEEHIAHMADIAADDVRKDALKKTEKQVKAVNERRDYLLERLEDFTPLQPYVVPLDITSDKLDNATFFPSYGTFLGFKFNKSFSPSSSTAVFATLDGRRKVEIPLSKEKAFGIIRTNSVMHSYDLRSINMNTWDNNVPTKSRKTAYIVTGNLLQALVDTQKGQNTKGYLVSYSTIDGETRQGILMPDRFQPKDLRTSVPIRAKEGQIRAGEKVESDDGKVSIEQDLWTRDFKLSVPKSKQAGGVYFSDRSLRSLIRTGEFETKGSKMVAIVPRENLPRVLDRLSKLGVTVLQESKLEDVKKGKDGKLYRTAFGGNSGYVGYSMSKRAASARGEGRFPKTDFKKEYNLTGAAFDALESAGVLDGSEWHHTSSYGNRTHFFSWEEEGMADTYAANKKEIDALSREWSKLGKAEPESENPYKLKEYSQEYKAESAKIDDQYYKGLNTADNESVINELGERRGAAYKELDKRYPDDARIREENERYYAFEEERAKKARQDAREREQRRKEIENQLRDMFDNGGDGVRYRTSEQLFTEYPQWLSGQTTSTGQHTTQITSTRASYHKIGEHLLGELTDGRKPSEVSILDASSGLGVGTQELRDMGFNVEDVEPYPSDKREAPTYKRYEDVNKKYDVVISNAVLNVIPDDWRADVLKSMADKLNVDGRLFINVRDAASIKAQKQKIELDEPSEILVTDKQGNIRAYQKGFTRQELADYVREQLGDGFEVETATAKNSGMGGATAVVVTRKSKKPLEYRAMQAVQDGETIPVTYEETQPASSVQKKDYRGNPYTVEKPAEGKYSMRGLDGEYSSMEAMLDAFRTQNPELLAMPTADGKGVTVEPWSKYLKPLREGDPRIKRNEQRARKAVEDMAGKLNLGDRVEIVTDTSKLEGEDKKAKGWYDTDTGKVTIVLPNHSGVTDVIKTILHEGVAHHGLRKLFGEHFDDFLSNVYENAEAPIRDEINRLMAKNGWNVHTATEEYLASLAERTDFEEMERSGKRGGLLRGWWEKVKEAFTQMLHKLGLPGFKSAEALTDNELRYVLWKSYKHLKGETEGIFNTAEDIAMQSRLEVGKYAKDKETAGREAAEADTPAETRMTVKDFMEKGDIYDEGDPRHEAWQILEKNNWNLDDAVRHARNLGEAYWFDNMSDEEFEKVEKTLDALISLDGKDYGGLLAEPKEGGRLYRSGDPDVRDRVKVRDRYERQIGKSLYQATEAMQDSMLGLKTLMGDIIEAEGKKFDIADVAGFENPYLAENRMSSMNRAEAETYEHLIMRPLVKSMASLIDKDTTREDVTDYMMAKHGLERNRIMAERDFDAYQKAHPQGTKTLDDFRARDYAGLTALTEWNDVAQAEAEAQQMVDDFEANHDTDELWDNVNTATKSTLHKLYQGGLLSKERYEEIRDMYENYIPLRGWDETTSDEVYGYLTSKDGAMRGSIMKKAEGRSSKADDPIATIAAMAEAGISQANRNKMKQTFLNFVLNHPSDAVSVNRLWLKHNDLTDEWEPVFADLKDTDDATTVEYKIKAFESRMEQLAKAEPETYKHGSDAVNIPYVVKPGNISEHQVLVQRGGHTYVLTINGNPRAAQALNGLTNPNVEIKGIVGNVLKGAEWTNRQLSAFYTTRNPGFVASNFIRDAFYSNLITWVRENPKYAVNFHKNFVCVNPTRIGYLLKKYENGTLDMSDNMENMFHQFMMNGGETGYSVNRDVESQKAYIKSELKKYKQKIPAKLAWQALGSFFDDVNRSVENAARFAAFVTSREAGRSVERSIYDAKEISVNFNKKGAGSKFLNAEGQTFMGNRAAELSGAGRLLYVFWNAGIQGLNNFGKTYKKHPVKATSLMASLFLAGAAMAMFGGDEDDNDKSNYYNLPDFVRRNNICFHMGGRWITIPLPIELRAFYGLGDLAGSTMSGHETKDNLELAKKTAAQLSQLLPVDFMEGGGGFQAAVPSSIKPVYEIWANEDWTGLPIYKQNAFNENAPEWTKAYKSANGQIVDFSKWCNEVTGGDEVRKGMVNFNPAKVEHLLTGYFGGAFTTINQLMNTGETIAGQREFDTRNIPVLSRLVKNTDERTSWRNMNEMYYDAADEFAETETLITGYRKHARNGEQEYVRKYQELQTSPAYRRYEIMKEYTDAISKLNGEMKNIEDEGNAEAANAVITMLKHQMLETLEREEQAGYPEHRNESELMPRDMERGVKRVEKAISNVNKVRKHNEDGERTPQLDRAKQRLTEEVERFRQDVGE